MTLDVGPYRSLPLRRFVREMTDGPFGSALTSSHYSDEGARVVRLGNIGLAQFRDDDAAYIPWDYYRQLRRHEVRSGDLIMAGLGDDGHPVGRACVAPDDLGPAIVKADCYRIRLDEQRLTHRFAAWALSSSIVTDQVTTLTRGSTRTRVNLDIARSIRVPVPSVAEQRRIADFLDAETARIGCTVDRQRKLGKLLDERESAEVYRLVDELTNHVDVVPLRRFVLGVDQGSSPQCDVVPAETHEWGVLKVSALRPGSFLPHENKRLLETTNVNPRHEVREGDLLITRANTPELVGSTAVVPKVRPRLLLCDKIFRVKLAPAVKREYVSIVARGGQIRTVCEAASHGASQSMANLRFEDIKAWPIPAVSLEEQERIVDRIETNRVVYNNLRVTIQRQIDLLAERKRALVTAAVTGQFDVTTARGVGVP